MTHLFFPPHTCGPDCEDPCRAGKQEQGRFERVRKAKALCNGDPELGTKPCPVKAECEEWALAVRFPHGMIAGLSERDRKKLLKDDDTETRAS